ncbi:hypothetical protein J2Y48_004543 [Mycoplana sp. BE70]|uniref:hypothetical protein n=1 Tax=Mycoplana sp. BE70 TaxID=2817775 RepID=UPI00285C9CA2|nr:hypothetical protein [Mycoplana sp. BE70]MDR6759227.1 hypothetical protein [Mycoplana sp. BE70]
MNAALAEEQPPQDEAAAILALHNGDALEAIRTLLAERDAIEEKLKIAAIAMGHGFARGWRTTLPGKYVGEG